MGLPSASRGDSLVEVVVGPRRARFVAPLSHLESLAQRDTLKTLAKIYDKTRQRNGWLRPGQNARNADEIRVFWWCRSKMYIYIDFIDEIGHMSHPCRAPAFALVGRY